jgi:hypothetical protein
MVAMQLIVESNNDKATEDIANPEGHATGRVKVDGLPISALTKQDARC